MSDITREQLKQLLEYDPNTGTFTWLSCKAGQVQPGAAAGHIRKDGYASIKIGGKAYKAHRLAWLYMTGNWPEEIDHRDRDPSNNRWENLREATHAENCRNRIYSNSTGATGVSRERNGRFRARIKKDGIRIFLGIFDTPDEAHAVVMAAKKKMHGEFATCSSALGFHRMIAP